MSSCDTVAIGVDQKTADRRTPKITPKMGDAVIRNVAVATDFSEESDRAVQYALSVSRHFGASLHLIHLTRDSRSWHQSEPAWQSDEDHQRDCEELIIQLKANDELDGIACHRWVKRGDTAEIMGEFVANEKIDLLVIGRAGHRALEDFPAGSISQEVFRHVRCPILTLGPAACVEAAAPSLRRILFATDLSRQSLAAIPYIRLAMAEWGASLDVLHIATSARFSRLGLLKEYREKIDGLLQMEHRSPVLCHLAVGRAAAYALKFANSHAEDLIVLGLKPHETLYSGSCWPLAWQIIRQAKCPVLCTFAQDDPKPKLGAELRGTREETQVIPIAASVSEAKN